jgi:hypothetical protein
MAIVCSSPTKTVAEQKSVMDFFLSALQRAFFVAVATR